jgi:dihydrolipoamide dehydrogenase
MKILKKQKINFHMQNKVEKIQKTKSGALSIQKIKMVNKINLNAYSINIRRRRPNTNGLNLEKIALNWMIKKELKQKKLSNKLDNVYAIGDVIVWANVSTQSRG